MLKRLIEWCVANRFLVIVFCVLMTVAGVWAMSTMPIDAIPDLSDVQVIIYTPWQGQDPQTVEDQITYPISSRMLNVPKVRNVRGYSFFGFSFVYVIFEDGTDLYWARSRVLEYLNQVQGELPKGATPSLGPDASGLGWVFLYTLQDTKNKLDLGQLRALQDYYVRYQLSAVPGVAEVASVGGAVLQYQVTVDPRSLAAYHLSIGQVKKAVQRSNDSVGGRVMEMAETEFMVRAREYVRNKEDLENVVVGKDDKGTPILLKDVAKVELGPDIKRGIADKNGQGEVVAGIVTMRYNENALAVIERVKKKIAEISPGLPDGVIIRPAYDRSGLIKRSIHTLSSKLIEELLIVAAVCLVFLWHARSALVSAITIPLGILMAFLVMRAVGINANIMSLGGIAVAIGAMVDAAVVMVENLHKHKEHDSGTPHWKMVVEASKEVGPALFFSLLIITVSFLPVFALKDQSGRLFKPLAFTKTFSMASAAILSVILLPILMGFFIRGKITPESRNPVSRVMIAGYLPVLRLALKYRKTCIAIALAILAITIIPYRQFGSEFMPPIREGDILYMPTTLPGLGSEEARRTLQEQDRLLKGFPEVTVVLGKIGRADTPLDPAPLNMVETHVILKPEDQWPKRIVEVSYLADLAGDMLDASGASVPGSDVRDQILAQTQRMSHAGVDDWIRDLLARGATMEHVRPSLPAEVAREVAKDLAENLVTQGVIQKGEEKAAAKRMREKFRGRIDKDDIPLRKTTFEELTKQEMNRRIQIPGMPNWWLMPIETRVAMLTTGMKGVLGLKLYGNDLAALQKCAVQIENVLRDVPGTASVVAERAMGGHYLDIDIDRKECARYGLTVGDVQDVIQTAVGGMNVSTVFQGRYRFPLNLRYPKELRDDPYKLERTLVSAPQGAEIPLGQLAHLEIKPGPPVIKSEDGLLLTNIPVDLEEGVDIGTYVDRAQKALDRAKAAGTLTLPPGSYTSWSGQYQFMKEVNRRLKVLLPVTLAIVFLLIYLNMRNLPDTLITMAVIPFALVGGVWLLHFLGYNLSVAVGIGFIALAGLAAETAIVMQVYLDLALNKRRKTGAPLNHEMIHEAVVEGAVLRVRPKMMTVMTMLLGLLPIMWAVGAGSGPMKRLAAPMIGGLVTSMVTTLILIPVLFAMVHERAARRRPDTSGST